MAADAIEREAERREGAILVALKQAVKDQTIARMEIVSTPDPVVEFARAVVASLRERAALEGDTTDQAAAIVELRAAVAASNATAVTLREALFNVVDAHDAAGSRNTDERLFRAIETARGRLRG